ncbi:MAG TPA: hypothetical protein VM942_01600, partial [Acidimicrobiales bacterium]|nr:hypothetical protein [Acidimicrobiales bacterium]
RDGAIPTLTSVLIDEPREIERAKGLAPLLRDLLRKPPGDRPTVEETRRRLTEVARAGDVVPDRSPTVRYDADALAAAIAAASALKAADADVRPEPNTMAATPLPAADHREPAPTAAAPPPMPPPAAPQSEWAPTTAAPPPASAPAAPQTEWAPTAAAPPPESAVAAPQTEPTPTVVVPPPPRVAPSPRPEETPPVVRCPRPAPPSGSWARPAAAVAALLVVFILGVLLATRDPADTETTAGQSPETTVTEQTDATAATGGSESPDATAPATTGAPRQTTAPARPRTTTAPRAEGVPADWVPYQDPTTGYTIAKPPNWTVTTNGSLTDIRDPKTAAYLRIDFTTEPGPSPVQAWFDFEPNFAAENPNYQRIDIAPTTFKGYDAALWEFTYTGLGVDFHAADLGFVTGTHGFALNFQTRAEDWEDMQDEFEAFKASFQAPA